MKYKIGAGIFVLAVLLALAGCFPGLVSGDNSGSQAPETVDVP
jgi:hypothetical protein